MSTMIRVNEINIHYKLEGLGNGPTIVFSKPTDLANILEKIASKTYDY